MSEKPAEYPALPEAVKGGSFFRHMAFFGPGAIIACVTIGSGETVFASRGGAVFGYAIAWVFIMSAIFKGVQVYSGARFMTLTGRHPLESWAELPGPRAWFVWLLAFMSIVWMPFWLGGGLPKMLGDFTNWIVGIHAAEGLAEGEIDRNFLLASRLWATGFIVVGLTFTWFQSYRIFEKVQTGIVALLLFCMLVAAAFSNPDLLALIRGTFVPTKPEFEPWLMEKYPKDFLGKFPWVEVVLYIGVIGGGTQDYFGYLGLLRAKLWGMLGRSKDISAPGPGAIGESAENLERGRRWLLPAKFDVGISFTAVLIFTACFLILGAVYLHAKEKVPTGTELLTMQAGYLVQADHPAMVRMLLGFIYKTGIFFAFLGTIWGAYELYTWTMRECLVAAMPRLRGVSIKKFRLATMLWCGIGGLVIIWTFTKDPKVIVTPAALIGSSLTCGLWCFAILWSDKVHVPKALRMGVLLRALIVVAGLALTVVPAIGIYQYVQKQLADETKQVESDVDGGADEARAAGEASVDE